tara:strand:+ start:939 stop:1460 length:522 start_codon:yes stop_codon:yes gene_type:complete
MQEHFVSKTDTTVAEKDLWQTPQELFDAIDQEFDFSVDLCASKDNKLCRQFFSEEDSALIEEWCFFTNTSCFINPPYSQTELFMKRSAEQAKKHNLTVVAVVNANTDTKWFSDAVKSANEVRLLTGRIGFIKPDGKKASGNPKGQCLIIWRGNCKTPCQITMVDRNELLSKGI